MIYLIEEIWIDPLENDPSRALGYKPIGYVETLSEANNIVYNGGCLEGAGWPIARNESLPVYRYQKITKTMGP